MMLGFYNEEDRAFNWIPDTNLLTTFFHVRGNAWTQMSKYNARHAVKKKVNWFNYLHVRIRNAIPNPRKKANTMPMP